MPTWYLNWLDVCSIIWWLTCSDAENKATGGNHTRQVAVNNTATIEEGQLNIKETNAAKDNISDNRYLNIKDVRENLVIIKEVIEDI